MASERRPATEAEAKALASTVRLRILRLCLDEALTNKEIAARLDANPATVLHHVRTLVGTGFLAPQPDRRGAQGAREIPYLATGKSWTVNVRGTGLGRKRGQAMVDAFVQEIGLVDDADDTFMYRLGIRLTDTERDELVRRLRQFMEELRQRRLDTTEHSREVAAHPYSMFVVLHPDVGRAPGAGAGPA